MPHSETTYNNRKHFFSFWLPAIIILANLFYHSTGRAQTCPPNIDFETGTFSGWTCYTGYVAAVGDQNVISLTSSGGPVFGRHTMYSSASNELDSYGGFPRTCPNGSGYSIKLGSTAAGGQAEGIAYQFTIPENENSYSLIYNYAVVFQSPNHRVNEQPRMEIETINVTDNKVIECASFTFISVGSSLPGFEVSDRTDSITVLYKNWSAVSVDLSGNAGKTIRLLFKTADCTFRRHFGYAYIDVNSECSGNFVGATYCPDDSVINVTAPYGYQNYTWYDSTLTTVLGTQQVLRLSPPPASGSTLAVKLDPYFGYGCSKTLFAHLADSLTVKANAGKDTVSCNLKQVPIGTLPRPGLVYTWSPAAGLSNPHIANPFASPDKTTRYILSTGSPGGGCKENDTVVVRVSLIDTVLQLLGKAAFCIGYGDSAVLKVEPGQTVLWYKDEIALNRSLEPTYNVIASGTYYALLTDAEGCSITSAKQTIIIDQAKPGITYPTAYAIINLPRDLKAREIGDNILWRPAISLNTATSFTPVFRGAFEQLYTIEIQTSSGCLTVDTQLVKTVKNVEIYVPNAFTPNDDGMNDLLRPILRGVDEFKYFRIFNRLGQMIFESKIEQQGWNGFYKGIPQQSQAVVWMLACVGLDGVVYSKKGTSVLLR